jgi:RNA polymerase sigma-70 factor (ECF subfamily)
MTPPTPEAGPPGHPPPAAPFDPEATVHLLALARAGDPDALSRLLERCLPPLRRWARGRFPTHLRERLEAPDFVRETVVGALARHDAAATSREGALQVYLRQALSARLREIVQEQRGTAASLRGDVPVMTESPLERAIGVANTERYEAALARLETGDREAVVARLELQYSYEELAVALDEPTPDAARAAVTRALERLAHEMQQR